MEEFGKNLFWCFAIQKEIKRYFFKKTSYIKPTETKIQLYALTKGVK